MKKRLLLGLALALCALLGVNTKTNAQATGISLDSCQIFSQTMCVLPANAGGFVMGYASGTLATNDSVTIYFNWGDGSDTTFKAPYSTGGFFYAYFNHNYTIAGTFTAMGIATTSNNLSDTVYSQPITFSNSCAPISGQLYVDANSDCTYNSGETALGWHTVVFHNTSTNVDYYGASNSLGVYNAGVPAGTYTVSVPYTAAGLAQSCPSSSAISLTVASTSTSYTQDIGFSCSGTAPVDLAVYAYAGNWRPGFNRPVSLYVSSTNGCVSSPATLTVTLPAGLSYTSTNPGHPVPTSVVGNTLTWNITSMNAFNYWFSSIMVYTATSATLGDTLCLTATISPATADVDPSNNSVTTCAIVSNSYDPNDKAVMPAGTGAQGYVANGTQLNYMVRFQNTGNDVAYTVTVKDMIDADLDLGTLTVVRASHPMQLSLSGREAAFRFDNINLPAASVNEAASQGYILYTIKPKPSLAIGTQLQNTADIYFDFNSAIVTNTTLNTIGIPSSVQHLANGSMTASVYPNPVNNTLNIDVKDKGDYNVQMIDMIGRTVKVLTSANGKSVISVKELPSGMYFLKLTNSENKVLSTKITVQH